MLGGASESVCWHGGGGGRKGPSFHLHQKIYPCETEGWGKRGRPSVSLIDEARGKDGKMSMRPVEANKGSALVLRETSSGQ